MLSFFRFLLQNFEEVFDLQRSVLRQICAVDPVPGNGVSVLGTQSARPYRLGHGGVRGPAQLPEPRHHILRVRGDAECEAGARGELPHHFAVVVHHASVHFQELISFAKIKEKGF